MRSKKITSVILALIMALSVFTACGDDDTTPADTTATEATTAPAPAIIEDAYKSVVIIGVDGMGAFVKDADTPNIDRIFGEGATTYSATTAFPSISGQSWGSMMIGSSAYVHGLTNGLVGSVPYENSNLPTIFKRVKDAIPDATLASYCHWEPINIGIVEDNIGVEKASGRDVSLHEDVADYLAKNDPTLFYTHFDSPDAKGHSFGYGSEKHLEQIGVVDGYIGKIYDTLSQADKLKDTLFMVVTDHGGTPDGSHGGTTDAEVNIFFGIAGKNVKSGTIGEMNIRDVAAITLYALGLEVPAFDINGFSAQIPDGIFEGYTAPERQPIAAGESTFTTLETPAKDSGKYISDFISADKVASVFHFNENSSDSVGSVSTSANGTPKYYSTGYFGSCIELGKQGSLSVPGAIPADSSFAVSLWFEHSKSITETTVLFASHDTSHAETKGFSATYDGSSITVAIGNSKTPQYFTYPLSEMMPNGWTNLTLSYDKGEGTLSVYLNFDELETASLSRKFTALDFSNSEGFVLGNDTADRNSTNIMLDELVFFSSAVTKDDMTKLAEYYSYSK